MGALDWHSSFAGEGPIRKSCPDTRAGATSDSGRNRLPREFDNQGIYPSVVLTTILWRKLWYVWQILTYNLLYLFTDGNCAQFNWNLLYSIFNNTIWNWCQRQ